MIFKSKQTVDGTPIWEVNTDTQTVYYRNPKAGETERYSFHADHIQYHLHHLEEYKPEKLQQLVDEGEIYRYLDDLDTKVTDAVNRQVELLKESSKDFQVANEVGNLYAVNAIGNALRKQAESVVFDAMIYIYK